MARQSGLVPLVVAHASPDRPLTEALGPIVVSLLAGLPIMPMPAGSERPRMTASGSVAHLLQGEGAVVWGSGCAPGTVRATEAKIAATRGPFSRRWLDGTVGSVYGDPAWLFPAFHRARPPKRWELGIVVDSSAGCDAVPADAGIRVIVARVAVDGETPKAVLDEILSCRRVLTTCVSGAIVAEAFGIPCLALVPDGGAPAVRRLLIDPDGALGPELADLYAGLRLATLPVFGHAGVAAIDWDAAIRAIDRTWTPAWMREEDLVSCFPLDPDPVAVADDSDAFAHPLVCAAAPASPVRPAVTRRPGRPEAVSLQDWVDANGAVPLGWAATGEATPFPNLGDALSATVTAAIAGLPIVRRNFDDKGERLVAVGTIGHAQRNGIAHLWGTGLDATRNAFNPSLGRFAVPPDTTLVVHAMRGRNSAARLRQAGVPAPEVHGDPVWFMPKLIGHRPVEPRYELGIVLHITELTAATPAAGPLPDYRRYHIPPSLAGVVKIINTYTETDTESLLARVDEIRACRRIASTSFHGLVIPETFGIPNIWFSTHPGEGMMLDVGDEEAKLDHRLRDWYSGTSRQRVAAYGSQRHLPTRWDRLIRAIDTMWEPLQVDGAALFDAFPIRPGVRYEDAAWPLDPAFTESMRY